MMKNSRFPFHAGMQKAAWPLATCIALSLVQAPALAQEDGADVAIEEITVTGIRRSLDVAADVKRDSEAIVDAITAQDIGLFSDNNIGEALSRIPGVLLEREAGEGYRISIRGLGPRYVRTTVNGRTALSASGGETGSGDDARGFTYNILPSEVITKATVSKSTMASQIEGGIGGTVDLGTTRPLAFRPDGDDFYISGALRGTYNDLMEDTMYRGTLFLNNRFSENFGVFFAAVFDQADRIDNLAESQRLRTFDREYDAGTLVNGTPLAEDTDIPVSHFSGVRYQGQPIPRERRTYVAGVQWQNDNWDINFDWLHGSEDETRDDKRFWYNYGDVLRRFNGDVTSMTIDTGDENLDITEPTQGTLVAYEFDGADDARRMQPLANGLYRRVPRTSDVNVGGINFKWHNNDDWTIAADFGYADQTTNRTLERLRTRLNTDWGEGTGDPRLDSVSGTYDITSGYPIAVLNDANGEYIDPLDTSHQYVELLERRVFLEEGSNESFRLDFTHELEDRSNGDLYSFFDNLQFGFSFNSQVFTRDVVGAENPDNSIFDMSTISSVVVDGILSDVNVPGFIHSFAVGDIADPVFQPFLTEPVVVSYRDEDGDVVNPEGLYRIEQSESFDITEDVTALYLQGNFSGEGPVPYRGNIGVRYVDTEQTNFGWVGEGEGLGFVPTDPLNPQIKTGREYDDWLPSFNLAFDLTDAWVLRFAANKALTRPDPIDMSSRLDLDSEDFEGNGGNPDLVPYTTVSLDMSVEWYPEAGGFYGLGIFTKDLESYIASGSETETIQGDEYDISRPVNTDGGTIDGVEFQFHTPFDSFTDTFWRYFGINGSFTYVDAQMDAVVPDRGTPISLRGTSERSGNFVVYFEREKFGARVAANYRSDYLFQEASDSDRFDEFTHGRTIYDMNLDYIIMKNMKIRLSANNLTDVRRTRFWDTPGRYYSDERDNGRTIVLEFRYASD